MANTVSILSYANTFGDWVVTTNALVRENNDIAANNYTKPTGTLYLNDPTLGLQVANNAIVAGQLQVQGVGSSAYVQNNLRVDQQVYFTNTALGLTNAGNAIIGGNLSVGGNFVINGSTVYSTNTFTLNANNNVAIDSSFNVNRGISGANASILWSETNGRWEMYDINSASYFKILTTNDVSSSLTSTSANTPASLAAANTLSLAIVAANTAMKTYVDNSNTSMKLYVDSANTSMKSYVDTYITLNNSINTTQNNSISNVSNFAQSGYNQANTATGIAQGASTTASAAYNQANTGTTLAQTGFNRANAAYTQANTGTVLAQASFDSSNTKVAVINGTTNQITVTGTTTANLSLPQNIHTGASVQFGSFGVGTAATGTTGEIRATNNITAYYSDNRLKTRFENIPNALDKVSSLNGFYYEANETAQALGYEVKREVGVSAQEVEAIMPEVVAPAPIDEQYLTVRYEKLVPLLIEAIKELKAEVDRLKNS